MGGVESNRPRVGAAGGWIGASLPPMTVKKGQRRIRDWLANAKTARVFRTIGGNVPDPAWPIAKTRFTKARPGSTSPRGTDWLNRCLYALKN
jgi:hypothetical protein